MERASLSVDWLVEARLERKWTQADVAEKVGVEVTTVRRWESGRCKPQPIKYRQLEELFGRVSMHCLSKIFLCRSSSSFSP